MGALKSVSVADIKARGSIKDNDVARLRQAYYADSIITPEEARVSKQRNVITRAVGSRDYVQVDTTVSEPQLGDSYLICSDGLHGYLRTEEIPAILAEGGHFSVLKLIDLANSRGGKDNITAIVVEVT